MPCNWLEIAHFGGGTFSLQGTLLSSKWRQLVPPEWKISTRLHGITSKKTLIVVTAIIASSMTSYIVLVYFINNQMFHINYTVMKDEFD